MWSCPPYRYPQSVPARAQKKAKKRGSAFEIPLLSGVRYISITTLIGRLINEIEAAAPHFEKADDSFSSQ